eukprot:gnl/Dysnectes_brevis/4246_a5623_664.p1 GENE.gnl/Dysnectes_brevis/4246_a5623_664~~gnl/Dysnectes_brevis/4246_a5623_664.p1  ORF type:complete len:237 (+),score=37.68 gnl/Dysnectes_brevis/4246_a5623_664:288-998(+)
MGSLFSCCSKTIIEKRVLVMGLDAVGKTTFLYRIVSDTFITTIPTIGFNTESVTNRVTDSHGRPTQVKMQLWDLGGSAQIRRLFRHYYDGTNGLIFIVDSSDMNPVRIEEARTLLNSIVSHEALPSCPLLILASKQDVDQAMSPQEIEGLMIRNDANDLFPDSARVMGCSGRTGEGCEAALSWLAHAMVGNPDHGEEEEEEPLQEPAAAVEVVPVVDRLEVEVELHSFRSGSPAGQ